MASNRNQTIGVRMSDFPGIRSREIGSNPTTDNLRQKVIRREWHVSVGMAITQRIEQCNHCKERTPHEVRLEIREENRPSTRTENIVFSREPYRIVTCQGCGGETDQRMNGA